MIIDDSLENERRIDNCIKAKENAEDQDFKNYWNVVWHTLIRKYKSKMILDERKTK